MRRELSSALDYALTRGFQIHPDAFEILEGVDAEKLGRVVREIVREKARERVFQISQDDLEAHLGIKDDPGIGADVRVLSDPTPRITSGEGVEGYNALFASRFEKMRRIVSERPEARALRTIRAALEARSEDAVPVCGLVASRSAERKVTKVVLEDPTGELDALVFDAELQKAAGALLVDQFVMARVAFAKNSGFVIRDIIEPDVPARAGGRRGPGAYAAFLSDLHVGSRYFMEDELAAFISWLSSPDPVARRVRFVLVGGDLVDGVGIYPNQDRELVCKTVEEQLARAEGLIARIPGHVKVVVIPGNHDPGRRALPQPAIPKKYNAGLWERENVVMVGNPATVELNGVRVAMFHGQSIDDIVKVTPGLSYDRPADVMKHLLRARHLSPIYGSQTPVAPESEDMMVIEEPPDIFHVGHVHRMEVDRYRGVLLVNSGSWQRQTPFQASVGMVPNPGIAVLVNLGTLEVFVKDFGENSDNVLQ